MALPLHKWLPAAALVAAAGLSSWGISAAVRGREAPHETTLSYLPSTSAGVNSLESGAGKQYPVTVNRPDGPVRVDSGAHDIHGQTVHIACATCHARREPNRENRSTADLDQFHKGLHMAHGNLSCLTCHNADDYDSLRLADGTRLEFADTMRLCAQCHGPQARDYERGAHGGMTGYWDLSRGPRRRNNCVDCHDPHAPAYPEVTPVFPPRDRFAPAGADHQSNPHEEP